MCNIAKYVYCCQKGEVWEMRLIDYFIKNALFSNFRPPWAIYSCRESRNEEKSTRVRKSFEKVRLEMISCRAEVNSHYKCSNGIYSPVFISSSFLSFNTASIIPSSSTQQERLLSVPQKVLELRGKLASYIGNSENSTYFHIYTCTYPPLPLGQSNKTGNLTHGMKGCSCRKRLIIMRRTNDSLWKCGSIKQIKIRTYGLYVNTLFISIYKNSEHFVCTVLHQYKSFFLPFASGRTYTLNIYVCTSNSTLRLYRNRIFIIGCCWLKWH